MIGIEEAKREFVCVRERERGKENVFGFFYFPFFNPLLNAFFYVQNL
jgi:hypothetical protein